MAAQLRRLVISLVVLALAGLGTSPAAPTAVAAASHPARLSVALSPCISTDNGYPDLLSFSVTPRTIDVRRTAQTVTLTVTAADVGGPGTATGITTVRVNDQDLVRQPDGTWQMRLRLHPGTRAGEERLRVSLEDGADNVQVFRSAWLDEHGMAGTYTVLSRPDRSAPALHQLTLSRTRVDTRTSAASVRVRAHVTDEPSGARWVLVQAFGSDFEYGVLHLVRGSRSDGWWGGRIRFRQWLGTGPHSLTVQMLNRAGRYREVGSEELAATARPSAVQVRSRPDDSRPTVRGVQVVPSTVDATTGDTAAVVRLHLSDTGSGVRFARVAVTNEDTRVQRLVPLHLRSGTRRDGTWEGIFHADACTTEAGAYGGYVEMEDRAGNLRLGQHNVSLTVVNLDRVAPRIAQLSPPTGLTDPVTITFTEDVVGLSATSAPVRPLRGEDTVDVDPLPAHPGTWSCRSATAVMVDCAAGPVRIAQWTPTTALTAGTSYVVDVNPEFVLDVLDLAGNPVREPSQPFVGPRLPG